MKKSFALFYCLVLSFFIYAQPEEEWGFLPIEFSSNSHGAVYAPSATDVYVVVNDGIIYKSIDGGLEWTTTETNTPGVFHEIDFADNQHGYAVGENGSLLKTSDEGDTWTPVNLTTSEDLYAVEATPNGNVWIVGKNGVFISSADNGQTWQEDTENFSEQLNSIKFRTNTEGFIAGNDGTLYHTQDEGQTWQSINVDTDNDLSTLNLTEQSVYLLSGSINQGQELLSSTDLTNWNNTNNFSYGMTSDITIENQVAHHVIGEYMLCECCVIAVWKSTDFETFWWEPTHDEEYHIDSPFCNFGPNTLSIAFKDEVGYVLAGNRLLKTPYAGTASVAENDFFQVKISPNPTQNIVHVQAEHLNSEKLKIEVYDINGKLLNTTQGTTSTNLSGFSSGVYFLHLRLEEKTVIKKVLKE